MTHSGKVRRVAGSLVLLLMACSVFLLRRLDQVRSDATLQEFLYLSSPKLVKNLSLGYEGLLADVYWTRAVQYYGGMHHSGGGKYQLLWPLLNITTQLDPHIIPAYQYGATFLTAKPPMGAGMPDKAIQLIEFGIRNNPDDWHLYNDLGFIYYMDLKDYPHAAEVFLEGSKKPNAHSVLAILAALAAQHGGERQTARALWESMYETSHNKYVREDAFWHLRALQVDDDVMQLETLVQHYRDKNGRFPDNFWELYRAGYLRAIPMDPLGHPYKLGADGKVYVADPDDLPFIEKGLPPGYLPRATPQFTPTS